MSDRRLGVHFPRSMMIMSGLSRRVLTLLNEVKSVTNFEPLNVNSAKYFLPSSSVNNVKSFAASAPQYAEAAAKEKVREFHSDLLASAIAC